MKIRAPASVHNEGDQSTDLGQKRGNRCLFSKPVWRWNFHHRGVFSISVLEEFSRLGEKAEPAGIFVCAGGFSDRDMAVGCILLVPELEW